MRVSKGHLVNQHSGRRRVTEWGREVTEEIMVGNISEPKKDTRGTGEYNGKS